MIKILDFYLNSRVSHFPAGQDFRCQLFAWTQGGLPGHLPPYLPHETFPFSPAIAPDPFWVRFGAVGLEEKSIVLQDWGYPDLVLEATGPGRQAKLTFCGRQLPSGYRQLHLSPLTTRVTIGPGCKASFPLSLLP